MAKTMMDGGEVCNDDAAACLAQGHDKTKSKGAPGGVATIGNRPSVCYDDVVGKDTGIGKSY